MVNVTELDQLRWIVLLPLFAAVCHGLMLGIVHRPTPRWLMLGLSCGSVFASLALVCISLWELIQLPGSGNLLLDDVYTWIGSGLGAENLTAEFALAFDPLSAIFCLVITGVSCLVHVYGVGYMERDPRDDRGFQRFFCYLDLLTFAMLLLVLGDSLLLTLLGWQGVGLATYLLIGFWYMDADNARAGSQAFIANRVGDAGFLVGMFVLFATLAEAGTPVLAFRDIAAEFGSIVAATLQLPFYGEASVVSFAGLCFLLAAITKSAQLPFHAWLPASTSGPIPMAALVQAGATATAGLYLICRLSFLFAAAPEVSALMAWIGALTALLGAVLAVAQTDIKKVLACASLSQLGLMFLAAGCGSYTAALFHMSTHAFFMTLLLLGAGAVILALHREQDTEKMGGLRRLLPGTYWLFLFGVVAITGVLPLGGFFSKDEILVAAFVSELPGGAWLYRIGIATSGLTGFFMWRLLSRAFYGRTRVERSVRERIEEPDGWLLNPLYALAGLTVLAGLAGVPQAWGDFLEVSESNSLANFVAPVLAASEAAILENSDHYQLSLRTWAASLAGVALAHLLYVRRVDLAEKLRAALPNLHTALLRGFYADELTERVLLRPAAAFSDRILYGKVEQKLIDGVAVAGSVRGVRALAAHGLKYLQGGSTQSALFLMLLGLIAAVAYLVG